jgi:hypothetical protein
VRRATRVRNTGYCGQAARAPQSPNVLAAPIGAPRARLSSLRSRRRRSSYPVTGDGLVVKLLAHPLGARSLTGVPTSSPRLSARPCSLRSCQRFSYQRPATSDQRPATSYQLPATSYHQLPATTSYQLPATSYQLPPATSYQLRATSYATSDQIPDTSYQRPATGPEYGFGRALSLNNITAT